MQSPERVTIVCRTREKLPATPLERAGNMVKDRLRKFVYLSGDIPTSEELEMFKETRK
jgi:hypothetical protein